MSLTTNCAGVTHVWADGEMCQCGKRRWHHPGTDRGPQTSEDLLRFVANALELRAFGLLEAEDAGALREASVQAFRAARALRRGPLPLDAAAALVRLGCLGVLGDRGADVRRLLLDEGLPVLPLDATDWGTRVSASILDIWLRLFRKQGWDDLDAVQQRVASLRADQRAHEPTFLARAEDRKDARPAWELMSQYHLAKAAEILGVYLSQGSVEGHYDIREQLEAQFDRAIATAGRGQLMAQEALARLLARTARVLVDNAAARTPSSGSPYEDSPVCACGGSVHVWNDTSAPDARCMCGEYSMRDWHNPDISRVLFIVAQK